MLYIAKLKDGRALAFNTSEESYALNETGAACHQRSGRHPIRFGAAEYNRCGWQVKKKLSRTVPKSPIM